MSNLESIMIDGSHGEGGGQVLRNSISFAAILNKKVKISQIRAGRSKPGLKAQHMTGLRLCSEIRSGQLEGCDMHSTEVLYTPSSQNDLPDTRVEFLGDTKTAGSICLVLQAALPVLLFARKAPADLILKGGTNASMAPQYDYWEHVVLPTLFEKFGLPQSLIEHSVLRRGYFPRGCGEVRLEVEPWTEPLSPIILTERGEVTNIWIRSYYAGEVPLRVANEMVDSAKTVLQKSGIRVEAEVEIVHETEAVGSGCGILLVATTSTGCLLAGSALGERKKRAAKVGKEAADELVSTLQDGGCVDEWLQDQLILFMALAKGKSEVLTGSLTMHTKTAIWVAEQLSGAAFEVTRLEGYITSGNGEEGYGKDGRIRGKHLIRCNGIGHVNK